MKEKILYLQYQYSKLFNLGFDRKRFELKGTEDRLFSENTSKNTFIALLFTLLASGNLFSGVIEGLNSANELGIDFYLVYFFLFIIGLIGFRQFLWLINGRQELTIENGTLTLTKKGTFLTKSKTYSFEKVANVRQAFDEESLTLFDKIQRNIDVNRKIIFGHIYGQILFEYDGHTIKMFCDLNKSERLELIDEMNKRKRIQLPTSH